MKTTQIHSLIVHKAITKRLALDALAEAFDVYTLNPNTIGYNSLQRHIDIFQKAHNDLQNSFENTEFWSLPIADKNEVRKEVRGILGCLKRPQENWTP